MSHKTNINLENLTCLNRIWHNEYDESLLSNWGLKSARNLDINLRNGKPLESFGFFGLLVEIDLNHCDDNGLATGRRMLHSVEVSVWLRYVLRITMSQGTAQSATYHNDCKEGKGGKKTMSSLWVP